MCGLDLSLCVPLSQCQLIIDFLLILANSLSDLFAYLDYFLWFLIVSLLWLLQQPPVSLAPLAYLPFSQL